MKAISIHQPFAYLICLPDDHPDMKRVENRTWSTRHRGPIAIHASKTKERLRGERYEESLAFGKIVAVARLVTCFTSCETANGRIFDPWVIRQWPWLRQHRHVEGPWCWLVDEVRPLAEPIPWKGQQGLFEIPDKIFPKAP